MATICQGNPVPLVVKVKVGRLTFHGLAHPKLTWGLSTFVFSLVKTWFQFVSGDNLTGALCVLIAVVVTTMSIIFSSNRIQNADILVLANPGSPKKMAIKLDRDVTEHISNLAYLVFSGSTFYCKLFCSSFDKKGDVQVEKYKPAKSGSS